MPEPAPYRATFYKRTLPSSCIDFSGTEGTASSRLHLDEPRGPYSCRKGVGGTACVALQLRMRACDPCLRRTTTKPPAQLQASTYFKRRWQLVT